MKSQAAFKSVKQKFEFGGELLKRARNRHARPVSSKDPTHLILKSSKAVGKQSFGHSRNLREVKSVIDRHCAKYGVKLVMYSNNFNHLHMLLKFPSRAIYMRFIRSLTGGLAMTVTGARKGSVGVNLKDGLADDVARKHVVDQTCESVGEAIPMNDGLKKQRFFDYRPFTRIVRGWKPYKIVCDYIRLNQLEAAGTVPYQKERLKNLSELERSFF